MTRGVVLALLVMIGGCASGSSPYSYGYYSGRRLPESDARKSVTATPAVKPELQGGVHVVNKGETLYSIAFMYGQDVREVAKWNDLDAPYTIFPKQSLRVIPPTASKSASDAAKAPTVIVKPLPPVPPAIEEAKISWQWPTNGKIIGNYSATDAGKKGLEITGQMGQPVHAAAEGRVVYSGNSLRGYGNLIILKHNEVFYSAYAHNERLLVKDDQLVKKGQHIADMGSSGTDKVMLHFEVRREGKPVDPLQYLPKRR